MGHDVYKSAKEYIKRDCALTQMIQQQYPDAIIIGDEVYLNIPAYPQINTSHLDIVKQYDPKKNPNLRLTYFWDVKSGTFKYVGDPEKEYTPPHYDEVRALELIRQGVDPEVAYKMCCKETVGPKMEEVSNGNSET